MRLVRSGKHTIVWGAMLSIAWGVAIAWMPEATGSIVMGGVVLIQVAAVCVQWIEAIDRRAGGS